MLEHTMAMPSTITQINLNRDSGLLAVVCDDLVVRLVDIETRRIVREMAGFRGRVLDLVSRPANLDGAQGIDFSSGILSRFQMACNDIARFNRADVRCSDRPTGGRVPNNEHFHLFDLLADRRLLGHRPSG